MSRARWNRRWLSLRARRGGASLVAAVAVVNLLFLFVVRPVLSMLDLGALAFEDRGVQDLYSSGVSAVILAAYVWAHLTLIAQRLRDIGLSGWFASLWLAVLFLTLWMPGWAQSVAAHACILLLALVPGTKGPNRYG